MTAISPLGKCKRHNLHCWFVALAIAFATSSGGCEPKSQRYDPKSDTSGKRMPPRVNKKGKQTNFYAKNSPRAAATTSKRPRPH
jgi:hypothetical protein